MTCYLRDINKFLRYCTLCKSILKCGFATKGIELTRFVLFEHSECHSWFVTHRKKLKEVDFVDEEFLHKKVNENGVYMRIVVCYRRYSRRHMDVVINCL